MPVPAWAAIADNEIDEESPITESLMTRLRNQAAAVIGYDPTSVSAPSFTLPPSTQNVENVFASTVYATGGNWATTAEFTVSVVADDLEDIQIGHYPAPIAANGVLTNQGMVCAHFAPSESTANNTDSAVELVAVNVPYSSGVPTSVDVSYTTLNGSPASSGTVSFPLDNAWYTLVNVSTDLRVQAKARATATHVYITFRCDDNNDADGSRASVVLVRKSFKSKN